MDDVTLINLCSDDGEIRSDETKGDLIDIVDRNFACYKLCSCPFIF